MQFVKDTLRGNSLIECFQVESFAQVKRWLPFLEQIEPEVQLLLCDTCQQGDGMANL